LVVHDENSKAASIWDVAKLEWHGSPLPLSSLARFAFSPDSRLLAVGDSGGIVLVNLPEGRVVVILRGHSRHLHDIAFSPDGSLLTSVDANGSVILWDPINARRISETLAGNGEDEEIKSKVRFNPDGMTLWADGMPLPAHPLAWIADICRRVDPSLAEEEWKHVFGDATYP
jgi:WD40 repeat protein